MPYLAENELSHWMGLALELADEASAKDEVPIGCVLVVGGKLLSSGRNVREESHRTTAHAEIIALESYNMTAQSWRLPTGTSVVVTAEPCTMCVGALLWARAAEIYFGCADPRKAGLISLKAAIDSGIYDHRFSLIQGGVREEECSARLKTYFKQKRGIA